MTSDSTGYITRILVKDYKLTSLPKSTVLYTLLVTGFTALLHPASFFEERTGKFNPTPSFIVKVRYSELRKMHKMVRKEFAGEKVPPFPPKKWIGNKNKAFLDRRMESLNTYLKRLLLIKEMCHSHSLLHAITPTHAINLVLTSMVPEDTCDFVASCLRYTPAQASIPPEYQPFISQRKHELDSPASGSLPEVEMILDGELVRVRCCVKKNLPCDQTKAREEEERLEKWTKNEFVMTMNTDDSLRSEPPLPFPYSPKSAPPSRFGSFASSDSPEPSYLTFRQFLKSPPTNCTN